MSPTAESITLVDLTAWTPGCLGDEATALDSSLENIAKARASLADTLDLLPSVWNGISADAVRRRLASERRYVDELENVFLGLRRCYNNAHQAVSSSHDTFMTTISRVEAQGLTIDFSSPAAGPITVSTTATATATADADADADESGLAAAREAAESIARTAGAVLDADGRHAEAIATLVADSESGRPPETDPNPLDTARKEKSLLPDRYDTEGLLGPTTTQLAINGLGLAPYSGAGILFTDLATDMAENRAPFGDALLDAAGARLSGRVGKTLGAGLDLVGMGTAGHYVGRFFGPEMAGGTIDAVLDASVGAAGRSFDERWGTELFGAHTTEQLARKALGDQERYGG